MPKATDQKSPALLKGTKHKSGKSRQGAAVGPFHFKPLDKKNIEICCYDHIVPNHGHKKTAQYACSILGYEPTFLCTEHKKEWIKIFRGICPE